MKTNVNWKPQGYSAKRWHGTTLQKDLTSLRQMGPPKKKRSSQAPAWKQPGS